MSDTLRKTEKGAIAYSKMLATGVYEIIQEWTKDMTWHGYGAIYDRLKEKGFKDVKMAHIKREVKNLRQCGAIERHPLFSEDTGLLCGSGFFACC